MDFVISKQDMDVVYIYIIRRIGIGFSGFGCICFSSEFRYNEGAVLTAELCKTTRACVTGGLFSFWINVSYDNITSNKFVSLR